MDRVETIHTDERIKTDFLPVPCNMATGTISTPKTAWTSLEVIDENTYGKLYGTLNNVIGMATIQWQGNGTTPGSQQYQFSLPAKYKPKSNYSVALRNGDAMEVRSDLNVNVRLTGTIWSGGVVTYPLA